MFEGIFFFFPELESALDWYVWALKPEYVFNWKVSQILAQTEWAKTKSKVPKIWIGIYWCLERNYLWSILMWFLGVCFHFLSLSKLYLYAKKI